MLQARQIRSALKGLGILLLTVAAALGGGYLLAKFGPLLAAAGLVALVLALWMLQNIEIAYWAVIGVVCLLPFASFPFDIGFRPTFLDAALGMLFVVWALRWMTDSERSFTATGLGGPVLLFLLLALTAFVLGLGHAPLTSYVIRHFAEILLSILLFFLVVNTVQDTGRLERLVRALILCAFAEAALGILLYAIPDDWAIRALSALRVLGYPSGPGVLRYIQDDPTLPQRATATSVDPNILGSLMNLSLALAVPQLFAQRPLIRRRYLVPILVTLALCLGLTISRGSMAGAGVALIAVATLRYRKLWWLLLAGGPPPAPSPDPDARGTLRRRPAGGGPGDADAFRGIQRCHHPDHALPGAGGGLCWLAGRGYLHRGLQPLSDDCRADGTGRADRFSGGDGGLPGPFLADPRWLPARSG